MTLKATRTSHKSALIKPSSSISVIYPIAAFEELSPLTLPFFSYLVNCGFPSPADDHLETRIDLNKELIEHPLSTFFVKVQGDSMIGASINHGDMLLIDRLLEPRHGDVVLAVLNGEFTVKRFCKENGKVVLKPENENYQPIVIDQENDHLEIWGVVTFVVHEPNLNKRREF